MTFNPGTTPTMIAARSVSAPAYPTVAGESPASSQNGQRSGPARNISAAAFNNTFVAVRPRPRASAANKSASSRSWVSIRPRVAPSAVLTRISLSRVAVRVSIKRATLPQMTINSRTANALIEWMPAWTNKSGEAR